MRALRALSTAVLAATMTLGWITSNRAAMADQGSAYVEKGRKLFRQYCASCHGIDGKGQGPVASALKIEPPDLTMIQASGDKFPMDRVTNYIDGEKAGTAHGTRKMPVWGTILRTTRGDIRHADIYSLAKYIESIQTQAK